MLRATVKGVLARKFRLALTGLAVLLGVMFVTTTYVLTDTLDESFQRVFERSLSGVDVVVRARPLPGGTTTTTSASPHRRRRGARSVDGVATAHGFVQGYAQFVGKDGEAIDKGVSASACTFVGGANAGRCGLVDDGGTAEPRPGRCRRGGDGRRHRPRRRVPRRRHRRRALGRTDAGRFTLVGLFRFGDSATPGRCRSPPSTCPRRSGIAAAAGLLDAVYVHRRARRDARRAPRVARAAARAGLRGAGPRPRCAESEQPGRRASSSTSSPVCSSDSPRSALVVGAFIIFNTFTILVTQRTRELGLLRAMGAHAATDHQFGRRRGGGRRRDRVRRRAAARHRGARRVLMSLVGSLGFEHAERRRRGGSRAPWCSRSRWAVGHGRRRRCGPRSAPPRIPPVAAIDDLPEPRADDVPPAHPRRARAARGRASRCCWSASPVRRAPRTRSASCRSSGVGALLAVLRRRGAARHVRPSPGRRVRRARPGGGRRDRRDRPGQRDAQPAAHRGHRQRAR